MQTSDAKSTEFSELLTASEELLTGYKKMQPNYSENHHSRLEYTQNHVQSGNAESFSYLSPTTEKERPCKENSSTLFHDWHAFP